MAARLARVPHVVHGEHGTMEVRPRNLRMQRWLWPRTDGVLSVSSRLAERMAAQVGFDLARIRVIPNGVDTGRFTPASRDSARAAFGLTADDVVIGTAGRLVPVKDQATLIGSLAALRSKGLRFTCVIAGDGPLHEALTAQSAAAGLADSVRFLGARNDIERVLAACDIFVLSSVSEGMSNTILEAMATGLPVVATRVGGADELVEEGTSGLLVSPQAPQALAGALEIAGDRPAAAHVDGRGRSRPGAVDFSVRGNGRRLRGFVSGTGPLPQSGSLAIVSTCMCGIAGRFNFRSGAPVSPEVVRDMCTLLAHRGPDGDGVWTRRRRRSRPSPAGDHRSHRGRPAADDHRGRRFWITFNGEIYNFLELRRQFESRRPPVPLEQRHRGDPRGVPRVGRRRASSICAACSRFAIWDSRDRTLFLARDRLGKKPLHYRLDDDGIAFASEPKAFLADPGFEARPELPAICAVPDLSVRAEPALGVRRRVAAAAGALPARRDGRRSRSSATGGCGYATQAAVERGRSLRGAARRAARSGTAAPDQRRAARRVPERRRRLERRRRADGAAQQRRRVKTFSIGFDEKRVRRARRTRGSSRSATAPTTTSSSSGRTRSRSSPSWCGTTTSRTPTRRRFRPTTCRSWRAST